MSKKIFLAMMVAIAAIGSVACEEKGSAERAGEQIDDAISDARDQAEDAANDARDALRDNE